jgi:hypothetical protein
MPFKLCVQATFVSNKSNPGGAFFGQPIERLRLGQAALEQCFARANSQALEVAQTDQIVVSDGD